MRRSASELIVLRHLRPHFEPLTFVVLLPFCLKEVYSAVVDSHEACIRLESLWTMGFGPACLARQLVVQGTCRPQLKPLDPAVLLPLSLRRADHVTTTMAMMTAKLQGCTAGLKCCHEHLLRLRNEPRTVGVCY